MTRILTSALFVLITQSLCGQSKAGEYLGLIGEQYHKISNEMMSYTSAVNHGKSARKVEKRRTELMQQVKESETTVRRMKPFDGSTTLRDSISAFFRLTNLLLSRDYGKIVDLEEIAEQSYDAMEAYLLAKEKAEDKLNVADENANVQYKAFAASNKITLVESESDLTKKIEKASKVGSYSNKVYLLFFKSYKNEAYLLDAMQRNDITALEQARNSLAASSAEDLQKSSELDGFNGDLSLKTALREVLIFYKMEATDKIQSYTQLLIAKDNFEKMKKAFDSTPSSKRTKESIDTYNKTVDDYNKKVNTSNAVNQELNKKRSAAIKTWNNTYDDFLDKHTPKHR